MDGWPKNPQSSELQDKLVVSEILMKRLFIQNQDLIEKLKQAEDKIKLMDKDYRTLQKQHLLLQHNIQNRIVPTRASQISLKTLGFKSSMRRNSFDRHLETQHAKDDVSSFWGDVQNSNKNYIFTDETNEDAKRRLSNMFMSEKPIYTVQETQEDLI